jgi:hypothetical protein
MQTPMLSVVKAANNSTAVRYLEEALEQARSGDIAAVAIAAVTRDGSSRIFKSTAENAVTLLGSVTRLLHEMNRNLDPD